MNFRERKMKGNMTERKFWSLYPDAIRTSDFAEDDFETKTGNLPEKEKYTPDFMLNGEYVEVKSSIFYNQAEYDYHIKTYPNMYVFIIDKLYRLSKLKKRGPYKGSSRGSGLPYYRIEL